MAVPGERLGELELEVLKVIWEVQPCTVQEVAQVIGERRGLARTTVLTVMQRLRGKGYLKRTKRQGVFRYTTTHERPAVIGQLVRQFVDTVLDNSALPIVAHLAQSDGLSAEQAAALRRIVRELEQRQGETGE